MHGSEGWMGKDGWARMDGQGWMGKDGSTIRGCVTKCRKTSLPTAAFRQLEQGGICCKYRS